MPKRVINNNMRTKRMIKRDLSIRKKYKTTYKDIKKYFVVINKSVFNNIRTRPLFEK